MKKLYLLCFFVLFAMVMAKAQMPVIAGQPSETEWNNATVFNLGVNNQDTPLKATANFSGNVKVLWDANTIYVRLTESDDSLNVTNGQPWEVDHFSIYFDLSNLKTKSYVSDKVLPKDSVQFMLEKRWGFAGKIFASNNNSVIKLDSGITFAEKITKGVGYVFEAIIPVKDSLGITLSADMILGFDTKIGDNDGAVAKLDGKLSWHQVKDESWQNPSHEGTIKLVAGGTVSEVIHQQVIDGVEDYRWSAANTFNLTVNNQATPAKAAANFSGNIKLMWDTNNMYVLLTEKDDSLNVTNGQPWEVDHYTVYFDLSNLKTKSYVSDKGSLKDSVQFMLEKRWGYPGKIFASNNNSIIKLDSGITFAEKITKGVGYVFEARIPLKDSLGVTLSPDMIVGFDAKIGDNDGAAAKLDGKLSWHQTHDESWQNPSHEGTIKLESTGIVSNVAHTQVIDGVEDYRWTTANTFNLAVNNQATPAKAAANFSGNIKVMWDANNFYVLLTEKDDSLNSTNGQPWEVDHYTVYFDLKNLKTTSYVKDKKLPNDSVQFMLEKRWGYPGKIFESNNGGIIKLDSGTQFVEKITKGVGYVFEARIPLKDSLGVTLTANSKIGFDAKIGDNDGATAKLDGKLSWHQVHDESWQNPSHEGTINLESTGAVTEVIHTQKIDGVEDYRWTPATTFNLDINNMATAKKPAANFSGNVKLMWDADNFYVLLNEKDDSLNSTNGQPWEVDHYSIYFDLKNLKTNTYVKDKKLPNDSIQFMLEKRWGFPGKKLESNNGGIIKLDSGVQFVEKITKGVGYVFEARIPLKDSLGVTLTANSKIGFDTKIGDNDGDVTKKLDGKLSWFQIADEGWQNPSYLGVVILQPNGFVTKQASNNAYLGALTVTDGVLAPVFAKETLVYVATLPFGTTAVPAIVATGLRPESKVVKVNAATLADTSKITVTAEDGVTTMVYKVSFMVASSVSVKNAISFSMYPSPVSDILKLRGISETAETVTIINPTGQVVATYRIDGSSMDIDVSNFKHGLFLIKVADKSRNSVTNKFIVQ